jgi:hypothetical protein
MKNLLRTIFLLRRTKSTFLLPVEMIRWRKRNFTGPLPVIWKRSFIRTTGIPGVVWIETGTYKGETSYFLSRTSKQVITIEPEPTLFRTAKHRLRGESKITVLEGTSEDRFKEAIEISGNEINFFLDGHASGGETYESSTPTPLIYELECIAQSFIYLKKAIIIVDDVRLSRFTVSQQSGYPNLNYLVKWANSNNLDWYFENDMFVAKYQC